MRHRDEIAAELNVSADGCHGFGTLGTLAEIWDEGNWWGCETVEILTWGSKTPLVRMDRGGEELQGDDSFAPALTAAVGRTKPRASWS